MSAATRAFESSATTISTEAAAIANQKAQA